MLLASVEAIQKTPENEDSAIADLEIPTPTGLYSYTPDRIDWMRLVAFSILMIIVISIAIYASITIYRRRVRREARIEEKR